MTSDRASLFGQREGQWQAFHGWESSREERVLALPERIAWYCAASRFARRYGSVREVDLASRAGILAGIQQRLAGLGTRNG